MRAWILLLVGARFAVIIEALIVAGMTAGSAAQPCNDCRLDLPSGGAAIPMLVVFDDQPAALATLRTKAVPAGYAVLAVTCGNDDACDAKDLDNRVYAAAHAAPIDLSRVYLVGSAARLAGHDWSATFAAIVIAGGGNASTADGGRAGCPGNHMPAYFLAAHDDGGMLALRGRLDRCREQTVWDEKKIDTRRLLEWLHRHRRVTTVA
jgi:hypothetical protein